MKILHTADWHLDTPFSGLSGERRDFLRQKLLTVPKTVMRIAENEGCSMVLIAGDVFDGPCSRDSLDAVRNAFEKSDLPIFISPGNHDFVAPDGPWVSGCWPENVHIFKGRLESVPLPELNCRVYGAGYNSMDCDALLDDFHVEGDEQRHIAVIHGDPISMSSPYSPVTAAQVSPDQIIDNLQIRRVLPAIPEQGGDDSVDIGGNIRQLQGQRGEGILLIQGI